MNDLVAWDYQDSVNKVRPMVINWRSLTIELVDELYRARESLAKRKPLKGQSDVTIDTWNQYLDDIGLKRMTVHRWLERYLPEENRILEPEELEERKQLEARANLNRDVAIRKRIHIAISTGKKPSDWDNETEYEYRKELRERADRARRITESNQRIAEEEERRRKLAEEAKTDEEMWRNVDEVKDELFQRLAGEAIQHYEKRAKLKERFKLSQDGVKDVFIDAIMDYLDELQDDNRRIEACNNIIKVCRNISVELQKVK